MCTSLSQVLTGGGVCMVIGAAANSALYSVSRFDVGLQGHLSLKEWDASQAHDLIYFGLLPPIIFEAGFHMNKMQFFQNIGTTIGFALLGTVLAVIATGAMVWALGLSGGPLMSHYTIIQAFVFGALISSTDPVATLGILKTVNATPLLYQLIFGESALNVCPARTHMPRSSAFESGLTCPGLQHSSLDSHAPVFTLATSFL